MRQPLIILCPGRSFSSVICATIGQHPECFGLPEVRMFITRTVGEMLDGDQGPGSKLHGVTVGLRRAMAELKYGEQTFDSVIKVDKFLAEHRDWSGGDMFKELCRLAPDRIMVDKSPPNSFPNKVGLILEAFPDAKYLHISRHPTAMARSRHNASEGAARTFRTNNHEDIWKACHRGGLKVAEAVRPDQYMFLHGEWFFEDPAFVLRQICEWLEISTAPEAIEAMLRPEDSPFACVGPGNAKYGNNPGWIENPHLRTGVLPKENMDAPLDFLGTEDVYLSTEVKAMAHILGYST